MVAFNTWVANTEACHVGSKRPVAVYVMNTMGDNLSHEVDIEPKADFELGVHRKLMKKQN